MYSVASDGNFVGIKYLKQPDQKSRIVGIAAIALTVIVLLWVADYTMNIYTSVTKQLNTQFEGVGGFNILRRATTFTRYSVNKL